MVLSTLWLCYGLYMAQHWFARRVWQCTSEPTTKRKLSVGRVYKTIFVIKSFAVVMLMYILSYGPILYIYRDLHWPMHRMERFYAPLIWLQSIRPWAYRLTGM